MLILNLDTSSAAAMGPKGLKTNCQTSSYLELIVGHPSLLYFIHYILPNTNMSCIISTWERANLIYQSKLRYNSYTDEPNTFSWEVTKDLPLTPREITEMAQY